MELLLDELSLGVIKLNSEGRVIHANSAAQTLLSSEARAEVNNTLSTMCGRAKELTHMVETVLSLGQLGEVRVLLSPAPCLDGYLAVLERSVISRLRAEATALRTMLSAATQAAPPNEAAHRALATLGSTFAGSYLVLYEHRPEAQQLDCLAHVGVPGNHAAALSSRSLDAKGSLVGRAFSTGRPLHVASLARSFFPTERALAGGERLAAIALPVSGRGHLVGVLYVCGPQGILGEGELKLLQGLADALGSLIEHSRQEGAITRERQALQSLMDNLPDAIVEQGTDGRIAVAGGRVDAILGRPLPALIGLPMAELLVTDERERFHQFLEAAPMGGQQASTFSVAHPDGDRVPCEVSAHVSRTEGASVVRAVFRDISGRLALEKEVERNRAIAVHKDRLAGIGQLAAGVAHEVNNPLTFVRANLACISDDVLEITNALKRTAGAKVTTDQLNELVREVGELATESLIGVDRIATIVRSLKGMARNRPHERELFNVTKAVQEAVMFFRGARQSRDAIVCELPNELMAWGDEGGLGQVVLNLMGNAYDAMGKKGPIVVRSESDDKHVRIIVADKGPGIPERVRNHIFEPFFTTKDVGEGTGLGLYISHSIVRQMGGTLTFETSSEGTTFTVQLTGGR
ncbi:MAG: GAF domain-containing protein [Myxococcaceae bacterium]|nr:GAF domain-containing protein [Myxococcaceae bacterium]